MREVKQADGPVPEANKVQHTALEAELLAALEAFLEYAPKSYKTMQEGFEAGLKVRKQAQIAVNKARGK